MIFSVLLYFFLALNKSSDKTYYIFLHDFESFSIRQVECEKAIGSSFTKEKKKDVFKFYETFKSFMICTWIILNDSYMI